jgi:hypothetical protein
MDRAIPVAMGKRNFRSPPGHAGVDTFVQAGGLRSHDLPTNVDYETQRECALKLGSLLKLPLVASTKPAHRIANKAVHNAVI